MNWEDGTLEAVRQQIRTPAPVPKPEPKFSAWSLVSAIPRGVAEAGAQVMASGVEVASAIQYRGMQPGSLFSLPEEAYQSDFADSLRNRGREFRPDPETAHAAEQVLYGFARGASKVIGGAVIAGPAGVVAAGGEEAMSAADDLKRQGVTDPGVRRQAAAVQGAGLALAALPVVGQTLKATAGLYAIGGPGGFMAQQALTRKILADAGFDQQAATFDPLDPVGLAVSALVPGVFAAAGIRGQRKAAAAKAEAEFLAGPVPSERSPVAEAYSPEVVDAARVAYAVEQRAAANLDPGSLRSHDQHEAALSRAEEAIARGEPVQVADVVPAQRIESLADFMTRAKVKNEAAPPEVMGDFVAFIKQAGGIDFAQKYDITGERSGVLSNPGGIFRAGGRGVDDIALHAEAAGYLRPGEGSDSRALVDMVQRAVRGERVLTFEQQMQHAAREQYLQSAADRLETVTQKLRLLGVDPAPAGGNLAALEAYARANEPALLRAALDEYRTEAQMVEVDELTARARQIAGDIIDGDRTLQQYEAEIGPLSPVMRKMVGDELGATKSAPETAAPQGKPRDLRAEVIALRKQTNVLNKLLECLNG